MSLSIVHIPEEKRNARQELEAKYLAWRLSGGQTTVIKREHLRMKRAKRWSYLGTNNVGSYVVGERQAPVHFPEVGA